MLEMDNESLILAHPEASDEELEELFAVKALLVNPNAILQNTRAFEMFTFAINGIIPNENAVDIPNVLMLAYAVKKAEQVLGKKLLFLEPADHTTIVYIANCCFYDGWVIAPRILSFCQKELNKLTSDYGLELFKDVTIEELETKKDLSEENAVNHAAEMMQLCLHYLGTKFKN